MMEFWNRLIAFFAAHPGWMTAATVGSAVMFFGTLLLLPVLISKLPDDFFCRENWSSTPCGTNHPWGRCAVAVLKNIVGGLLVLVGVVMLVAPGQGILTIILGLVLIDFPGKHRSLNRMVHTPKTWRAINWMRRRAGCDEFLSPKTHQQQVAERSARARSAEVHTIGA